jgi:hypothetical protein
MTKRRKLSKRELKKRRSQAAKRGWITRRERQKEREARQERYAEGRKGSIRRELEELKSASTSPADYTGMLESRLETLQDALARVLAAQEIAEHKVVLQELVEKDPIILEQSWKQRIFDAWNTDPTNVPSTVKDIWDDIVEYELQDYYDEGDIWDIYKEG